MSKRKELERLVGELESGGISRRDFVWRAMALGLSMSSVGALLSACAAAVTRAARPAKAPAAGRGRAGADREGAAHLQLVGLHRRRHGAELREGVRGQGDLRYLREQRGDGRQAPGGRHRLRHHRALGLHHPGAGGDRSDQPRSTRSTSPTGATSRRSSRTCRPIRAAPTPCRGSGAPAASPTGPTR